MKAQKFNKEVIFCSKIAVVFLLCILFLFTSCGKEKVVEKLIYGDTVTNSNNENNGNSGKTLGSERILSREQFNSVAITREFNNFGEFISYLNQNKNLVGLKFKIRGSFTLRQTQEYNQDLNVDNHYYYKALVIATNPSNSPYYALTVNFADTNLNSNISNIQDVIFIVQTYRSFNYNNTNYWNYNTTNNSNQNQITITGYSYL